MRKNLEILSSYTKNIRSARVLKLLAKGLRNALFPARCIDCLIEGTWYCSSCRRQTPPHLLQCMGCKIDRPSGRTCKECREDTPLTGFISARSYSEHSLQRGIEWLKFKGVRPLAPVLAGLLIPKLPVIAPIEYLNTHAVLVPLPLHAGKLRQRGFNQSEDIARAIGTLCDIEVLQILSRTSATTSQAHLPHEFRTLNMQEAFELNISKQEYEELVATKPIIIIIDDVSTTGATLLSAANAFPKNPDAQIWGAAVARG